MVLLYWCTVFFSISDTAQRGYDSVPQSACPLVYSLYRCVGHHIIKLLKVGHRLDWALRSQPNLREAKPNKVCCLAWAFRRIRPFLIIVCSCQVCAAQNPAYWQPGGIRSELLLQASYQNSSSSHQIRTPPRVHAHLSPFQISQKSKTPPGWQVRKTRWRGKTWRGGQTTLDTLGRRSSMDQTEPEAYVQHACSVRPRGLQSGGMASVPSRCPW